MTKEELNNIVREYYEAHDAWTECRNKVIVDLISPDGKESDLSSARVDLEMRRLHSEVIERLKTSAIAFEQAHAELRLREVEAHEWMIQFRKLGMQQ